MFGLNQGSIYSIITIIFFSYYTRQKVYPILVKFYNDVNFFRLFTLIMSSQEMIEVFEENEKNLNKNGIYFHTVFTEDFAHTFIADSMVSQSAFTR